MTSLMLAVSLDEFLLNFRLADALDILLAALFLSLGLRWLRRRATQAVAIALIGGVMIYVLARALEMYLTLAVFQVGLTVFLLVLVIVFQQDIRHELERLSFSRLFTRGQLRTSSEQFVNTLVEGTALLAEQRTGALLVLKGRQPLDRHIRGGISADSLITIPLLHSIFNPKSQGHDGAAMIVGERLASFGVHLPLSSNLDKLGSGGTRHAAALGLAERSDALVIVVSEERGSISLADSSDLTVVSSPAELRQRLEFFLRGRSTAGDRQPSLSSTAKGLALNAAAFLLACGLWFVFAFRVETIQQEVRDVPVEFRNLPDDWRVERIGSDTVNLNLTGPERAFTQFDPRNLKVSLELDELSEGVREVPISPDDVNLPPDVKLGSMDAPSIEVELQRYVRSELPIRVRTTGRLPGQLQLVEARPLVARWPVLIRSSGTKPNEIMTAPIDLSGIIKTVTREVDLTYPSGILPAQPNKRPTVTIEVKSTAANPPKAAP